MHSYYHKCIGIILCHLTRLCILALKSGKKTGEHIWQFRNFVFVGSINDQARFQFFSKKVTLT